jgi:hypothetical protein
MGEDTATTLDARTAEVLRCLDRAKGTIAKTAVPTKLVSAVSVADELRGLGQAPSQATPDAEAMARSLDSAARALERVLVIASERLSDLQRGQDGAVRELRDSIHALLRQVDVLAAWRSWWTRQITAWALLLALLFAAGDSPGGRTPWRRTPTTSWIRFSRTRPRRKPPRPRNADDPPKL